MQAGRQARLVSEASGGPGAAVALAVALTQQLVGPVEIPAGIASSGLAARSSLSGGVCHFQFCKHFRALILGDLLWFCL